MAFGFLKAPFKILKGAVKIGAKVGSQLLPGPVGLAARQLIPAVLGSRPRSVGVPAAFARAPPPDRFAFQTLPSFVPQLPTNVPSTDRFSFSNTIQQFLAQEGRKALTAGVQTAQAVAAGVTVRPKVNPLFIVAGIGGAVLLALFGAVLARK